MEAGCEPRVHAQSHKAIIVSVRVQSGEKAHSNSIRENVDEKWLTVTEGWNNMEKVTKAQKKIEVAEGTCSHYPKAEEGEAFFSPPGFKSRP